MNDFVLNDFVRSIKSKVYRVEKLPLPVCSFISQGNKLEEAKSNFENLVNNKAEFSSRQNVELIEYHYHLNIFQFKFFTISLSDVISF